MNAAEILLVCEDQQNRLPQFIFCKHSHQLVSCLTNPLPVITVHHEDQSLCILKVVSPQRPDLVLTSHVPDSEADVFILHSLDIEAYGRDGRHNLPKLKFVEDCGLASSVQPHHQDSHLLLAEEPLKREAKRFPITPFFQCFS